jgi:hypothetical protein
VGADVRAAGAGAPTAAVSAISAGADVRVARAGALAAAVRVAGNLAAAGGRCLGCCGVCLGRGAFCGAGHPGARLIRTAQSASLISISAAPDPSSSAISLLILCMSIVSVALL